jgi:hypothetical protein
MKISARLAFSIKLFNRKFNKPGLSDNLLNNGFNHLIELLKVGTK